MADQYVAEIRIFGFNFAPIGWATCNGQIMPITQNTALFSLLGTTYGGNGTSTFGLPDLQARAALAAGQGPGLSLRTLGEIGGEQTVTLLQTQMPSHNHIAQGGGDPIKGSPQSNAWGSSVKGTTRLLYAPPSSPQQMNPLALTTAGGSQPHNNLPPYLTLTYCIALTGLYPPRG